MIGGVHTILYSKSPDELRTFFRDVLKFRSVDAGHGWLIFAAPPGELAIHPAEDRAQHELFLMCSDIHSEVAGLKAKGVKFTMPITDQRWGLLTKLKLPDGELLGLYQPKHPMAIKMTKTRQTTVKRPRKKRKPRKGTAQPRRKRRP